METVVCQRDDGGSGLGPRRTKDLRIWKAAKGDGASEVRPSHRRRGKKTPRRFGDGPAEAGRSRVNGTTHQHRGRVSARTSVGSDTRRDCSPLKTEECGLHTSTRRAFSAARLGLLRETFGSGWTSQGESERPRWCERSWSSRAKRARELRMNPGQGDFEAAPRSSTLRDGWTAGGVLEQARAAP